MIWFERELIPVHGLLVFEVELVFIGFATSKIGFGGADDPLVPVEQLEVLALELIRNIEICWVLNFVVRKCLGRLDGSRRNFWVLDSSLLMNFCAVCSLSGIG